MSAHDRSRRIPFSSSGSASDMNRARSVGFKPPEYRASPLDADPQSPRRALRRHIAAEAEQRRGSSARLHRRFARRLDDGRGFNEPAEILLVQAPAGKRASTLRCSADSVKLSGISSKMTGRYFIVARKRPMAVARMRRFGKDGTRASSQNPTLGTHGRESGLRQPLGRCWPRRIPVKPLCLARSNRFA